MVKIVQKEEKVLRQIAKEVSQKEIGSPKIKKIIEEMRNALALEKDGVGLAAPQIGFSLRIFIIAPDISERIRRQKKVEPTEEKKEKREQNLIFINPEIIKLSKEKKIVDEGCLSVRPLFGKIERSIRAKIKAYDENGNQFERGASALQAQIFQHEVDHLNGILFIDNATDIKEMPSEVDSRS